MTNGTVLIVDTDPDQVRVLREALEDDGFDVLTAQQGEEAWQLCRRHLPQAVVLSLSLPDVDGYEILRRIRNALRTRHIHVTLLTERHERRDKIAGLELGADDYVVKPFDLEELRLRVRNALRRAQAGSLTDPATGLPGRRLIQEHLRELLTSQHNWALLRITVRHLDAFSEVYGFMAGEDFLRLVARLLTEAVDELGTPSDFIGHSGGEEFVIITDSQRAAPMIAYLEERFPAFSQMVYSYKEREQGYLLVGGREEEPQRIPLMSLEIRKVTAADGPFSDIVELTEAIQ